MKHLLRLLLVSVFVAVLAIVGLFTPVRPAHAACTVLDVDASTTGTLNLVMGHSYTVFVTLSNGTSFPGWPATFIAPATGPVAYGGFPVGYREVVVDNSCGSSGGGVTWFTPGDDRINQTDAAQPAAIYCRKGDVQVWAVGPVLSIGKLSINATKAEIDKVKSSKPIQNTLIKASADGKLKLYYLPATDELSFITTYLNSSKPYTFVWKGCQ